MHMFLCLSPSFSSPPSPPLSTGAEVKGAGEATPTCSPVKDASKQQQTTGECGHCTYMYASLFKHVGRGEGGGGNVYMYNHAGGL